MRTMSRRSLMFGGMGASALVASSVFARPAHAADRTKMPAGYRQGHNRRHLPRVGTDLVAPWQTVSTPLGGLASYRGYNTPGDGVPTSWPGPHAGPIPAGVTLPVISIRPNIPDVLSGALDEQLAAYARLVPPGAMVTCWHEGERANLHYTPTQVTGLHEHVYPIFKANSPHCLYGQIVTTYSSTNGRLTPFTVPGLDYYGLDAYPRSASDTPYDSLEDAATQMETAGATGPWAIAETNSEGNSVNYTRPQWFLETWAWAVERRGLAYVPFWLPGSNTDAWPPDRETVEVLRAINWESKFGSRR